jgi:hypothetical protein
MVTVQILAVFQLYCGVVQNVSDFFWHEKHSIFLDFRFTLKQNWGLTSLLMKDKQLPVTYVSKILDYDV